MNRLKFLNLLKKSYGYTGVETLEAVKSFLAEKGIEPAFEEGKSLDKVWADAGTKKVAMVADPDPVPTDDDDAQPSAKSITDKQKAAGKGKLEGVEGETRGPGSWSKKAYDRKAKMGQTNFDDADTAERFAAWARLKFAGPLDYSQKKADAEILKKSQVEYSNILGGNLVPVEFIPNIIRIREMYGVASQIMDAFPMSRDTVQIPREYSDVTVYGPGEANSITASDMNWDLVQLSAFKLATLSVMSSELMNDAAVNVADRIANSIAYAHAKQEDECLFNGDGTSTYFSVIGLRYAFQKLVEDNGGTWTTDGDKDNCAGLVLADGNAWSEITLANIDEVASRLPTTYENRAAWICHKRFFYNVMLRIDTLPTASVTSVARDFPLGDRPRPMWRGYPVVFAQAMPRVEANSAIPLLFGDVNAGAKMGRVNNSFEIATSDQRYFEQDLVAIRSKQRLAFNVHDIGNYNSTASSQEPGPICGLVTKNS
jgi:HK97 family phage major capsid protein